MFVAAMAADAHAEEDVTGEENFDFEHVSCNGGQREIRLVVTDVEKSVGLITADVYPNDPASFLKGRNGNRITQVKYAAKSPVTNFCITLPETGDYAIAVYHDKNANEAFDKNFIGFPAEPWGISNNPKVTLSPPSVEEALFSVDADGADVEIHLN
jgi:uncharacterized protein (DUF2141 family)